MDGATDGCTANLSVRMSLKASHVESVWADLLSTYLCFRDGDGLRVNSVLCHWSHPVPDVGRHLTHAKVSTTNINE